MSTVTGLKVTLFAQVGFREISLNPETKIKLNCCK